MRTLLTMPPLSRTATAPTSATSTRGMTAATPVSGITVTGTLSFASSWAVRMLPGAWTKRRHDVGGGGRCREGGKANTDEIGKTARIGNAGATTLGKQHNFPALPLPSRCSPLTHARAQEILTQSAKRPYIPWRGGRCLGQETRGASRVEAGVGERERTRLRDDHVDVAHAIGEAQAFHDDTRVAVSQHCLQGGEGDAVVRSQGILGREGEMSACYPEQLTASDRG